MENVEEVSNDLYVIRQEMRPGWFCSVIVVLGINNIGVIDTGYEGTPQDYVFPLIQELGREIEDIDIIINTHRDGDHIRGNEVFKQHTGAPVAVHLLEVEAVPSADILLNDAELLELGDRSFKVIHTPGHRPGAICLYDQENKLLITGDSVCGERKDLIRMNKNIYIESLKKLREVDTDIMIMSHPFKPAGKNILVGYEIKDMIKASIEIAEKL